MAGQVDQSMILLANLSSSAESGVNAQEIYDHYVLGNPEPLRSQMTNDKSLEVHLLSTIATIPGMKKSEIYELFESTVFCPTI